MRHKVPPLSRRKFASSGEHYSGPYRGDQLPMTSSALLRATTSTRLGAHLMLPGRPPQPSFQALLSEGALVLVTAHEDAQVKSSRARRLPKVVHAVAGGDRDRGHVRRSEDVHAGAPAIEPRNGDLWSLFQRELQRADRDLPVVLIQADTAAWFRNARRPTVPPARFGTSPRSTAGPAWSSTPAMGSSEISATGAAVWHAAETPTTRVSRTTCLSMTPGSAVNRS